ncbi:MAG: sensor histidine kinase N-terminal domain-containing protein [bacterium]
MADLATPPPRAVSLTLRLAVALTLILSGGGAAVAIAAIAYGQNAAQQSYDRLLIGAANQIAEALTLKDGAINVDIPLAAFELLALAPQDRIFYAVYGPRGELITGYDGLDGPKTGQNLGDGTFTGAPVRLAEVDRRFAERSFSGTVRVVVGQTTRARAELTRSITRSALLAVVAAGLLMSGLAIFAVRSALGPLQRIERDLAARAPTDLTPLGVAVPREIGTLVSTMNRFMARIDRQVAATGRLIGDASHQLRTPIAAIRAQSELAAGETDPARQHAIVARIHRRAVSLSRLTDQLLNHALIINRTDAVPLDLIDLRRVAMQAVDEIDHDARSTDTLKIDLPEDPVMIQGDSFTLVEACKNLAANALRHGVPPAVIVVRVEGRKAVLAVRDNGPGMPEDHWPDAGTRFARRASVSPTKVGLGLSIVDAVARAHHGEMSFGRTSTGHFEARISVPLIKEAEA